MFCKLYLTLQSENLLLIVNVVVQLYYVMVVCDGKEHEVQKLISIDILEVQSY
jgi:hypothetical protein